MYWARQGAQSRSMNSFRTRLSEPTSFPAQSRKPHARPEIHSLVFQSTKIPDSILTPDEPLVATQLAHRSRIPEATAQRSNPRLQIG
jgi:hypothetical protein